MHLSTYKDIIDLMELNGTRKCLDRLKQFYPNTSERTLGSIYAQEYQKKMKKCHHKYYTHNAKKRLYLKYMDGVADRHDGKVLVRLGQQIGMAPALLARLILEYHLLQTEYTGDVGPPRQVISNLMKNTTQITDPNLAIEVHMCVVTDEVYGPYVDTVKHSIGLEYEYILANELKKRNLAYLDEDQLRARGYDKTPDAKLEVPIAVNGHVVNWIESKASFGDEDSHRGYLKDQFWSYWNRFGPGLVIYWFGFIEELDSNTEKGILLMDHFPTNIVTMTSSSSTST